MKKVCILGHFGFGETLLNGQTIKTKIVAEELKERLGEEAVLLLDTSGGKKKWLQAPIQAFLALRKAGNVIILPAQNGIRIFAPLLILMRFLFSDRRLHYIVIGGWLPEFLKKRRVLTRVLRRFDYIYVETRTMRQSLSQNRFRNLVLLPNCKALDILECSELSTTEPKPFRFCTFSRVMKEKGIADAVQAVMTVNAEFGRVCTLDIYGPVEAGAQVWFDHLQKTFPDFITYCGCVPYSQSVERLKNYDMLLFPTRFYTEGIPGTMIDAFAAGLPVLASRWESFEDVIEEGRVGFGYKFGSQEDLIRVIKSCLQHPRQVMAMKQNCLRKAATFLPSVVLSAVVERLEEGERARDT